VILSAPRSSGGGQHSAVLEAALRQLGVALLEWASSSPLMIWSRRASAASTSIAPATARAAPGTRRTSARAAAGRSNAFDGMHA